MFLREKAKDFISPSRLDLLLTPLEVERKSLTQSRQDAKNPQSFSLRYLCGSASLRESFCFFCRD